MQKLVYYDGMPDMPGLEDLGDYNHMPTPWREISPDEFWYRWDRYVTSYEETRQVWNFPGQPSFLSLHIFWYHDFGLGIAQPMKWRCRRRNEDKPYGIVYEERPRFFRFGCDHEWMEYGPEYADEHGLPYTSGRCFHNNVCKECGALNCYDSSD